MGKSGASGNLPDLKTLPGLIPLTVVVLKLKVQSLRRGGGPALQLASLTQFPPAGEMLTVQVTRTSFCTCLPAQLGDISLKESFLCLISPLPGLLPIEGAPGRQSPWALE